MSNLTTVIAAKHISCVAKSAVSFTRGLRGTFQSDGTYDLSGITDAGQIVCDVPTSAAAGPFTGLSLNASIVIPASSTETTAVGDAAYTAAAGQFSKSSGSSALKVGIWRTITAANAVGSIMLSSQVA